MYRNFLWDGRAVYSRSPPISWDIICRPKKQVGLGVQDCVLWNTVTIGKNILNNAKKKDTLWVQWANHIYLKGKSWKRFKCPSLASWNWKQIWSVKDTMKSGYIKDMWLADKRGYTISSGYTWLLKEHCEANSHSWVWNIQYS